MTNKKFKKEKIASRPNLTQEQLDTIMLLAAFGFDCGINKENSSKEELEAYAAGVSLNLLMNVINDKSVNSNK